MKTSLVSPAITTNSDTCFSFWFIMLKDKGVTKLEVVIEHVNGVQDTIWSYYPKVDFWESGQILLKKSSNYNFNIRLVADHGDSKTGFAAVDDFEFIYESDSVACKTKPSPEPPLTTTPDPDCAGKLTCSDGLGCYSPVSGMYQRIEN